AQGIALLVLWRRLLPGRKRLPPVPPAADPRRDAPNASESTPDVIAHKYSAPNPSTDPSVTVIVATLNEAARIAPCLQGLQQQGASLLEVLVVDSNSTDGTRAMVEAAMKQDPRFRLLTDGPLPAGWVGKVWALETGLRLAKGEWILGIDADTVPKPGMIAGILRAMRAQRYDAASFGPRFIGQTAAERWLQPAMLITLVYRTGAAGAKPAAPDRVLANGQCFVARRETLLRHGGYAVSRASFSDDVTLARHLAQNGERVGFLDGSRIIDVRAYASLPEMWREWGRSFDLKDGASFARRWLDVAFIWLTMALPVPVLLLLAILQLTAPPDSLSASTPGNIGFGATAGLFTALAGINVLLLGMRFILLYAIRGNYGERGWTFWMSWLADIPAAIRLTLSTARRPRVWRGRMYDPGTQYQS
ncbi:MAG: glycosyltransferase family 2 protein, partial [Gemmatimonadaceae bacterium]